MNVSCTSFLISSLNIFSCRLPVSVACQTYAVSIWKDRQLCAARLTRNIKLIQKIRLGPYILLHNTTKGNFANLSPNPAADVSLADHRIHVTTCLKTKSACCLLLGPDLAMGKIWPLSRWAGTSEVTSPAVREALPLRCLWSQGKAWTGTSLLGWLILASASV